MLSKHSRGSSRERGGGRSLADHANIVPGADDAPQSSSMARIPVSVSPGSGVCMMSTSWKEEQHPVFLQFISSFLQANSYRLNLLQIAPDFIFNNGGTSVAFIFITSWDYSGSSPVFSRAVALKRQFKHLYVVVSVPTKEQNDSLNDSYFKHGMELGSPTFIPVCDPEMGFEKIVKIAHTHGVCKRQDVISLMKLERKRSVEQMECFLRVITSIPGIDNHDANAVIYHNFCHNIYCIYLTRILYFIQSCLTNKYPSYCSGLSSYSVFYFSFLFYWPLAGAIGSIEAISRASKDFILENTDLSVDKAERIFRFFRDPNYYLGPKIN